MSIVISVENLSKTYHLGQIGTGTFSRDLELWWAKLRGKPNLLLRIGEQDHGNRDGEELWALRDVSFTVKQGEVLGIIGRNGAGKSTLLKILSRVTAPTSGKIKVKGRVASLLEVGTGFHPELTGRENIYLNGAILGMSQKEIGRKFDEIVDFAEVEKFIDTPVKRYSSGMYVRLAFAVAAHLEPEILVVDEVLAVGDAEFQKKCLGKMGEVAKGGRTVLFVSHNMGAVKTLCTNGILLMNGGIVSNKGIDMVVEEYFRAIGALSNGLEQQTMCQQVFDHISVNSGRGAFQNEALELSVGLQVEKEEFSGFSLYCIIEDMSGRMLVHDRRESTELNIVPSGYYKVNIKLPALWLSPGLYSIYFKVIYWGLKGQERYVSDKYPLHISGESNKVDSLLIPEVKWLITSQDSHEENEVIA